MSQREVHIGPPSVKLSASTQGQFDSKSNLQFISQNRKPLRQRVLAKPKRLAFLLFGDLKKALGCRLAVRHESRTRLARKCGHIHFGRLVEERMPRTLKRWKIDLVLFDEHLNRLAGSHGHQFEPHFNVLSGHLVQRLPMIAAVQVLADHHAGLESSGLQVDHNVWMLLGEIDQILFDEIAHALALVGVLAEFQC